jgi:Flp pilus assembly protein TadG
MVAPALSAIKRFGFWVQAFAVNARGAAAAEFALVLGFLLIPLVNAMDFGIYVYQAMELNDAAQSAAEAALVTCSNQKRLPATINCPGLSNAATTAAQSTSLGASVTISSTAENYYCVNSAGVLVTVGTFPDSKPADCSSAIPGSKDTPGDYVLITASFAYQPLFTAVSLATLFKTPITQTVWMRLA